MRLFPAFIAALVVLAICSAPSPAAEKKRFVLYATFLEDTPVDLSDGARWMMDKGDSFPILMFKEQQTRIVLQLAGAQFSTEVSRVKVTPGDDVTPEMVANYRKNVAGYIDGKSEKIRKDLKGPTKSK